MIVGRAERLHDLTSARALEMAERSGHVEARIGAAFELATIPLLDGGPIEPLVEVRDSAVAAGVPVTAAYVDLMLAHRYEDQLELEAARETAQRCAEAARRSVVHVRDGKVTSFHMYFDVAEVLVQRGLMS